MRPYFFTNPYKGDFDLSKVKVFMISNRSDAEEAIIYLKRAPVLFVDCEGHYFGNRDSQKLALIQIAIGPQSCFIFDIVECPEIVSLLKDIFECPRTTKVFHDCSGDNAVLSMYGVRLNHRTVYDTLVAQCELEPDISQGINKNYLSILYSGKDMKTRTVMECQAQSASFIDEYPETKWFKRPLKERDIAYAAVDVLFLIEVYRKQKLQIPNWSAYSARVQDKLKAKLPKTQITYYENENVSTKKGVMSAQSLFPAPSSQKEQSSLNWGKALTIGTVAAAGVAAAVLVAAGGSEDKSESTKQDKKDKKDDDCTIS